MSAFWAVAVYLFLSPASAQAACDSLRFQHFDGTVNLTSDTFPTISFEAKRNGSLGCSWFITCDNGAAASFSTRRLAQSGVAATLPVQLCLDGACANICKHYPEAASASDVISGTFPDGTSSPNDISVSYRPKLGAIDYPKFGTYEDVFTFRLYDGTVGGVHTLVDTDTVTIKYTASKAIDLSLVDTGAAFDGASVSKTLSLGSLFTGKTGGVDLLLKYNAGYRIRLKTDNGGKLKRVGGTQLLDYTMTLNGGSVTLSTANQTIATGSGVSPSGGERFAAVFTMGTVGPTSTTGSYTDSLTFTVATTE